MADRDQPRRRAGPPSARSLIFALVGSRVAGLSITSSEGGAFPGGSLDHTRRKTFRSHRHHRDVAEHVVLSRAAGAEVRLDDELSSGLVGADSTAFVRLGRHAVIRLPLVSFHFSRMRLEKRDLLVFLSHSRFSTA